MGRFSARFRRALEGGRRAACRPGRMFQAHPIGRPSNASGAIQTARCASGPSPKMLPLSSVRRSRSGRRRAWRSLPASHVGRGGWLSKLNATAHSAGDLLSLDERPEDPAHRLVESRGCGRHDWSCTERDELRPMTRYVLRVYRGPDRSAYYPDKTLRSFSRGRLARRGQKLEREGFRVRLVAIAGDRCTPSTAPTNGKRP